MITVLLTGAGAPGTSGTVYALRHNPDGEPVKVVGTDINPDTPGRYLCSVFQPGLEPNLPDYPSRIRDIAVRNGVDVILPQCTVELSRLADNPTDATVQGIVRRFGAPVAVASSEAIARANDKGWIMANSPMGPWFTLARHIVIKPRIGSGKRGYQRHACPEMVMEYLPGPEYSVDCFIGQHCQGGVARIRHAVKGGVSTDTEVIDQPDLVEESLRLGNMAGLKYAYGVQFKEDAEGNPKVIDLNPRIMGTMICTVLAGVNIPWMAVKEALGEGPTRFPAPRVGIRYQRVWMGYHEGRLINPHAGIGFVSLDGSPIDDEDLSRPYHVTFTEHKRVF